MQPLKFNRWSLGMDKEFPPTLNWAYDYLFMLGLKWNHVSKGATGKSVFQYIIPIDGRDMQNIKFYKSSLGSF